MSKDDNAHPPLWRIIHSKAATRQGKSLLSLLLVLPAAIYMLLVIIYPLLLLIWFGFTERRIGQEGRWVGIENFQHLLASGTGQTVVLNTLRYAIISTLGSLALGLVVALLLYQIRRWRSVLEGLVILPWAIPPTVTALIWLWMFYDIGGVINWLLLRASIISMPISWLGIGWLARLSVVLPNIWRLTPFFAICLLSARANIESSLYEAAALDGACVIRQFFYVTLPGLSRSILVTSAFGFLWSATEFPLIYILTRGGPANSTHLLSTLSYDLALRGGFELGLGAACALLLLPISAALAFAVWRLGSWHEV